MQTEDDSEKDSGSEELESGKDALNSYAKYTGAAFQMMGIIAVCAFLGYKADQYYHHKTPWVTALACVFGVCISIYQLIRQLKK